MAVGSFIGQADAPLTSTWLRSADQLLPHLYQGGIDLSSVAWETAVFGTLLGDVRFTDENDTVAATGAQAIAAYVAFTDENDTVAAAGSVTRTATVAFIEANDIVSAAGAAGGYGTITVAEDDDIVAIAGNSFDNMISPATIDAEQVIGPIITSETVVDEILVATIDASSEPVGPLYVANEEDEIFTVGVYIQLFDTDGVTLLDTLDYASDVDWFDEANGTGTGSFVLPADDTVTAALCTPGRLVRCYLYGIEAFTWEIGGPPERSELKIGEEGEETLKFSGNGWAGLLDDVIVEPAIPVLETEPDLSSPFGGRDRIFSFASPDFPNDNWGHAMEHYEYSDLQPFRFQTVETLENIFDDLPSPVAMPYPNSDIYLFGGSERVYWIWPGDNFFEEGWGFFRGILIDPPAGSQYTISCSADNLFILYIDGVPVLGEQADTLLWTGYKEVTVELKESRWYMFGAAVQNTQGTGGFNPGGWLCASYYPGNQGEPSAPGLLSNSGWTAYFSATTWPGWTSGQIAQRLLYEGNLRGAVNGALGYTFTDFSDTAGVPWAVTINGVLSEFVPTFAVRVGSTVLEALVQLHDEGWVNWHMRSGTTLVDMWGYDSPNHNSGITLFESSGTDSTDAVQGNLVDIERQPDEQLANALLVAYDDGVTKYVRVTDDASIAAHGRHEEVWDSGGTTAEEATRMGSVELRKRSVNEEGGAIVCVIEPRDLTEMPYHAFNVLHTVAFPSLSGGTFDAVVYSIGVRDDGDGFPIIALELNKRWPDAQRDTSRLLRTIGGKSQGSWKGRL